MHSSSNILLHQFPPLLNQYSGRFILTGGPGAGKTTLINFFQSNGLQVVPEAYTLLQHEAEQAGKLHEFLEKRRTKLADLYDEVFAKQLALERSLDEKRMAFLDRATHDNIFYGYYRKVEVPPAWHDEADQQRYDLVFCVEVVPEEHYSSTQVRGESREEALSIHAHLRGYYLALGYHIVDVPFDTLERRAHFILNTVHELHKPCGSAVTEVTL